MYICKCMYISVCIYMYILLNSINFYLHLCNFTHSSAAFSYSSFSNIYDKNIRLDLNIMANFSFVVKFKLIVKIVKICR